MRTRVVIDGQQVEIPVLRIIRNVGTQEDRKTGERKYPVKHKGMNTMQITYYKLKCKEERRKSSEVSKSTLSRKAAIELYVPVPQTDTGRRGENPQTDGRSVVKELGKMTP